VTLLTRASSKCCLDALLAAVTYQQLVNKHDSLVICHYSDLWNVNL
jgi:hypothetical protein